MDTTNLWQTIQQGILPVPPEVAAGMSPETIKLLRQQALLQMGLGMVAAKEKGAQFGTGALAGLNIGQNSFNQGLGQAYAAERNAREDKRLQLLDERTQAELQRRAKLDEQTVKWKEREFAHQEAADKESLRRWNEDQALERRRLALQAESNARAEANAAQALKEARTEKDLRIAVIEAAKHRDKFPRGSNEWNRINDMINTLSGRGASVGSDSYDIGATPQALPSIDPTKLITPPAQSPAPAGLGLQPINITAQPIIRSSSVRDRLRRALPGLGMG